MPRTKPNETTLKKPWTGSGSPSKGQNPCVPLRGLLRSGGPSAQAPRVLKSRAGSSCLPTSPAFATTAWRGESTSWPPTSRPRGAKTRGLGRKLSSSVRSTGSRERGVLRLQAVGAQRPTGRPPLPPWMRTRARLTRTRRSSSSPRPGPSLGPKRPKSRAAPLEFGRAGPGELTRRLAHRPEAGPRATARATAEARTEAKAARTQVVRGVTRKETSPSATRKKKRRRRRSKTLTPSSCPSLRRASARRRAHGRRTRARRRW
mmetsp:Transcript_51354/g.116788  ORF Transcript_51354/g.116788 Transcript_51354/m.116788 type:complete len:261 (+) Transcript_51354:461-1243(+)